MMALFRFLRSVRLAVVLILIIIVLAAIATLIPQGREEGFYRSAYSPFIASAVVGLQLYRLYSSILFLVPVGLFAINLGVCTVDRIATRERTRARRRYGPDLIHVGLLVLIAGAVISGFARREEPFYMAEGDEVQLPDGTKVGLISFQFLKWATGSPKDWISTVRVTEAWGAERTVAIEVNRPLRVGAIRIYQSSYAKEGLAHLADAKGAVSVVRSGDVAQDGDSLWYFADVQQPAEAGAALRAVFQQWKGHDVVSTVTVMSGDRIGSYRLTDLSLRDITGLTAVSDPGLVPVLVGFSMVATGLALTFLQKRGEKRP